MKHLDIFINNLWNKYTSYTPSASEICKLFGEEVVNDHIAFRTFDFPSCNIEVQAKFLSTFNYKVCGDYF